MKNFIAWFAGVAQLKCLVANQQGMSDQAFELREVIEDIWQRLTKDEQVEIRVLCYIEAENKANAIIN